MSYLTPCRIWNPPLSRLEGQLGTRMMYVTRHFSVKPGTGSETGEFKWCEPYSWGDGRAGVFDPKSHCWFPGHRQKRTDGALYGDVFAPRPTIYPRDRRRN